MTRVFVLQQQRNRKWEVDAPGGGGGGDPGGREGTPPRVGAVGGPLTGDTGRPGSRGLIKQRGSTSGSPCTLELSTGGLGRMSVPEMEWKGDRGGEGEGDG